MQKIAFLIAALSLGAGCASQGNRTTASATPSSASFYPSMTYQGGGENMRRDAAGNVIIETPATVSQRDPALASGSGSSPASDSLSSAEMASINGAMESDRSINPDLNASASGGFSGVDTGASVQSDELSADGLRWTDQNHHSRADFENAEATGSLDSSVGGPAEAEVGVSSHADDAKIKADSSQRGGSDRARQVALRQMDSETPRDYSESSKIKADSSTRGGSDRARGVDLSRADMEPAGQSGHTEFHADSSERGGSDRARGIEMRGAARQQSSSSRIDATTRGGSYQARGLDTFWKRDDTGAPMGRVTSNDPDWLFKNNPAQGVPAPAQVGVGSAFAPGVSSRSSLADRVKHALVARESGTGAMLSKEIARNIKVTEEHGTIVLRGSAPDEKTSRLLEIRASEVNGVTKVDNELVVSPQSLPENRDSVSLDLNEQLQK
jgi:hypothetical protein